MVDIKIVTKSNLTDELVLTNKSINDDAFADLLDLPEDIQSEIDEKFIVTPWRYLFAQINDTYVGRIVLDKRTIKLNDTEYEVVGINGLAVRKNYQRKGIGRQLMNDAIVLCKKEGIDAVFLNAGEELHPYYKSFGFVMRSYEFIGKSGKLYLKDDGMILALNEDSSRKNYSYKSKIIRGLGEYRLSL